VSQLISEVHVRQFKDNLTMLYQQTQSRLRGTVMERSVTGEVDFWDRVGVTNAQQKLTRHTDTPQIDTPFSRRMCTVGDWHTGDLIDKQDVIRVLTDPTSPTTQAIVAALNRALDSIIYAAFDAAVLTGKLGTTTVSFDADWPNGNRAAGQGDDDFSAAAIDIDDLLALKKQFDENEVPDEGRHILLSPGGFTQLLTTAEVGSSDYNTVKALVRGEIGTYLGFNFHRLATTQMTVATGTDFYCYAWHQSAMGLSVGLNLNVEVAPRTDKSFATQVYAALSAGAVRVQGEGLIRFLIDNAA